MKPEEKQALVEAANKWIELMKRYVENNPQDIGAPVTLRVFEVALTALTAQPVKLPEVIQQTETAKYGLEPHDGYGLYWGSVETLKQCKELLRKQGYEVQE